MAKVGRLVVGIFNDSEKGLFGLKIGQERNNCLVMDAGWYNAAGERLGHGDLSPFDLLAIIAGLEEDEIFVVLPRVSGIEIIETVDLASRARFVIRRGRCIFVTDDSEGRGSMEHENIHIEFATRDGIEAILL